MYLEQRGRAPVAEDMPVIACGQVASEDALARRCERLLVCDTDALTTRLWSELLFGACDDRVARLADERTYELTLVTAADVPYVEDPVRYATDRAAFFERCVGELRARGRAHVILRGSWDERFARACEAIDDALESVRARTRGVATPLSYSPPPR
jgi:nicotinamide riboside kinase